MARKKKSVKKPVKQATELTPEEIKDIESQAEENYEKKIVPEMHEEQEKAQEEFNSIIKTEDELLEIFSPKRLEIKLLYQGNLFNFTVKQIEPTDDLSILELDSNLYADLNEEDMAIVDKLSKGEELTKEEQAYVTKRDKERRQESTEERMNKVHNVLAQFVTPPDFEGDIDKRLEFWGTVDFLFKTFLFAQVLRALGFDQDSMVKLFQGDGQP